MLDQGMLLGLRRTQICQPTAFTLPTGKVASGMATVFSIILDSRLRPHKAITPVSKGAS